MFNDSKVHNIYLIFIQRYYIYRKQGMYIKILCNTPIVQFSGSKIPHFLTPRVTPRGEEPTLRGRGPLPPSRGRRPGHRRKSAWKKSPNPSAKPSRESSPRRCKQNRSLSSPVQTNGCWEIGRTNLSNRTLNKNCIKSIEKNQKSYEWTDLCSTRGT